MKKKTVLCVLLLMLASILAGCFGGKTPPATEPVITLPPVTQAPTTEPPTEPAPTEYTATEVAEIAGKATVTVYAGDYFGSGFFIDDQGTLITCYHVIDGASDIYVETSTGAKYDVDTIVDFSEMYDIAILSSDASGNDYLEMCQESVKQGETVYALGSSRGLDGTFSNGIVSAVDRVVGAITCIQTNAAISGGNSGGPLLNTRAQVIGINAMTRANAQNANFAIDLSMLDHLTMDKNWSINEYQEWYVKELKRSFPVYDYDEEQAYYSKIHTYQNVTGRSCSYSTYDWAYFATEDKGSIEEGYNDQLGVFIYEYRDSEFDEYTDNYLKELGFVFAGAEERLDWYFPGTFYFYENEFTGITARFYVFESQEWIVIELIYS